MHHHFEIERKLMITNILKRETCANCLICCHYTDDDVWDAPGFTKKEFEENSLNQKYDHYYKNGLFYLRMEKINDEYVCPLLSDVGCKLHLKKPFKCAIWPLYIVKTDNKIALAVSNVCPNVFALSDEDIMQGIKDIMPDIKNMARNHPELIEQCRDNFRILSYL